MLGIFNGLKRRPITSVEPDGPDPILIAHAELATKLGVGAIPRISTETSARLRDVLREECITVYDFDAVVRYMNRITKRKREPWGWMPLRRCDRVYQLDVDQRQSGRWIWQQLAGSFEARQYSEPIPYPALCTVDRLVEHLGDEVSFFVAAIIELPKLDPFLAVRLNSCPEDMYVIERWDEPSFRG